MRGLAATSSGGPFLGDEAVVEHQHPGREGEGVEGVVGDQQGHAGEVAQVLGQLEAQAGRDADVEAGERLVEEQHGGLGGQRASQGDPLGLATGELVRTAVRQRADAEPVEPRLGDVVRRRAGRAAAARAEGDVVQRAEVREELLALEGEADAPLAHQPRRGARSRPGLPGDLDGADVAEQARDGMQQGGLAGAVGAEHRHHLAGVGGEGGREPVGEGEVDVQPAWRAHGTRNQRSRSAPRMSTDTSSRIRLRVRATSTSPWSSV